MSKEKKYTNILLKEMLNAFVLFTDEGMGAVRDTYPQHLPFVQANKNRSYQEIKTELLQRSQQAVQK